MEGMHNRSGDRTAAPRYPLTIGPDQRHLVDQDGAPVLILGDAAWSILVALTRDEVEQYLANRQRKGFNSILVNLIEHYYKGPQNLSGDGPFTTPGDFSTPNESYFAHADWVIQRAADHGIQVFLAPIYLGARDEEGWIAEALDNGLDKCRAYGRYVGQRYADADNIIWVMGGDRNPGSALEHVNAIAAGIKEHDDRHLFTAHCAPESPPVQQYPGDWLNLNNTYTYEIVHRKLLADYRRTPVMPFFLMESTYEGEHNASEAQIRRQAYWAILCGGTGHIFGNNPIWLFDPGWPEAIDAPGSRSIAHLRALFGSRAWHDLVPNLTDRYPFKARFDHALVTQGLGELRGLDYVAAARTADGGTVIAYMPMHRTVTIDLSWLSGDAVRCWWFDPRTGEAAPAGEFAATGPQDFTPLAEGDWVLVLDDAGRNLPAPGTTSAPS